MADKVRNLAQRCSQAAKDKALLIETSITKSAEGGVKVQRVAALVRAVADAGTQMKDLVDEMNLGRQEQSTGLQQINRAPTQLEQVTQRTSAIAEESASASEELSGAIADVEGYYIAAGQSNLLNRFLSAGKSELNLWYLPATASN